MEPLARVVTDADRVTMQLAGRLDLSTREQLVASCDQLSRTQDAHALVLDLTMVEYVDAGAVRILDALLDGWTEMARPSVVVCVDGPVERVLDLTEFDRRHNLLTRSVSA
jgi:anti-anti-sigma factor